MSRLLSEVVAAFRDNGVPIAHVRFRDDQAPPYAEAHLGMSRSFNSDNRTSRTLCEYDVVLYVRDRDLTREHAIEDALAAADITWRKMGGYNHDSDLVTTTYQLEVFER